MTLSETHLDQRECARYSRRTTTSSLNRHPDNFPTRYLVNDACVILGKPNVYGSIFRFEGQITIFSALLMGLAIAASIPNRLLPVLFHRAPKVESWVCFPELWARFRPRKL